MQKKKIPPVLMFTAGTLLFATAFLSIILTELGLLRYETSRYLTIPAMLILSLLSLISVIAYRKGLLEQISQSEDRKYFIIGLFIASILPAIAFLLLIL